MYFKMVSWMSVQSQKQKINGFERDKDGNGMPVPPVFTVITVVQCNAVLSNNIASIYE